VKKKSILAIALCCVLITVGCISASQFEAILNEIGPAVSTIIQIVALVENTPANTNAATKVSSDVAGIETIYNTWVTASATAQPGLEGEIDAGFTTLNTDLSSIFSIAQVSDPNTQAKVSALISLVQTAVGIAEAMIPSPAGRLMAVKTKNNKLTVNQMVDSWNGVLVAKTGNVAVDEFTPKHKLHTGHHLGL
jgi:hypothetical protein